MAAIGSFIGATYYGKAVEEGERNNTLASITGHLLWHGVELVLC